MTRAWKLIKQIWKNIIIPVNNRRPGLSLRTFTLISTCTHSTLNELLFCSVNIPFLTSRCVHKGSHVELLELQRMQSRPFLVLVLLATNIKLQVILAALVGLPLLLQGVEAHRKGPKRLLCAVWPLQAFSFLMETRTRLPEFSLQRPPQSSSKHSRACYPTHNMVLLFHAPLLYFPTSIYILGIALVILLGQQCLGVDLLLHGCITRCRHTIKRLFYCSCFLDKFLTNSCTFFSRQTSNDSDWIHGEWLSGYIFKGIT